MAALAKANSYLVPRFGLDCGARAPQETMVSYQRFTALAFEVAKEKGMETSQENSQELIQIVAEEWNDNKQRLSTATNAEARKMLRAAIQVQR